MTSHLNGYCSLIMDASAELGKIGILGPTLIYEYGKLKAHSLLYEGLLSIRNGKKFFFFLNKGIVGRSSLWLFVGSFGSTFFFPSIWLDLFLSFTVCSNRMCGTKCQIPIPIPIGIVLCLIYSSKLILLTFELVHITKKA